MKNTFIIIGIIFVFSTAFELWLNSQKKKRENKLVDLLMNQQYDQFDQLLNDKSSKFFISAFNSLALQLNKAIMKNDNKEFLNVMKQVQKTLLKDNEKQFLYSKAFSFSLSQKDEKRVEGFYQQIEKCKDTPTKKYIEMVYDTVVKKGYQYIDQAIEMAKNSSPEDQKNLYTLIGNMYDNKEDHPTAVKYYQLADH